MDLYPTHALVLVLIQMGTLLTSLPKNPRWRSVVQTANFVLESCPPEREAIAHHMAGLSVYLGHASVANTYWYLEATPVLLRDIAAASEQLYRGEAA